MFLSVFSPLGQTVHKRRTSVSGVTLRTFWELTYCLAAACSPMCTHSCHFLFPCACFCSCCVSREHICSTLCLAQAQWQSGGGVGRLPGFVMTMASRSAAWRNGNKRPTPRIVQVGSQGNVGWTLVPGCGLTRTYPMKRPSPA